MHNVETYNMLYLIYQVYEIQWIILIVLHQFILRLFLIFLTSNTHHFVFHIFKWKSLKINIFHTYSVLFRSAGIDYIAMHILRRTQRRMSEWMWIVALQNWKKKCIFPICCRCSYFHVLCILFRCDSHAHTDYDALFINPCEFFSRIVVSNTKWYHHAHNIYVFIFDFS